MTLPQLPGQDSLRAVVDSVMAAPAYQWQERRSIWDPLKRQLQRLWDWLLWLGDTHPVAYAALMIGLTVILVGLLVHMGWVLREALRRRVPEPGPAAPAMTRRDARWHLARAAELAARGDFAAALAERFAALVLDFQQRGIVRFHPSKTPAEYAMEARIAGPPREQFTGLVEQLYRHLFGAVPCSLEEYRAFDERAASLREAHAAH